MADRQHHVLISQGPAGLCIYINGYRVVGEKPWGGGRTVREWTCSDKDMRTALKGAESPSSCNTTNNTEK